MTDASVKMDAPFEHSLLDDVAAPLVGRAVSRIEGPLKVSGQARYSAEYALPNLAHGVFVRAPFGSGRVVRIDADDARAMPGVLAVIADERMLRNAGDFGGDAAPPQGVTEVLYFGQPIAIAVADTFEAARAAAQAVRVEFEATAGNYDFVVAQKTAFPPTHDFFGLVVIRGEQGNVDHAMAGAAAAVDQVWTTPSHAHAAMEPHASIAEWKDGRLTIHGSYQSPVVSRNQLASALGLAQDKVRIISSYVGGGFGGKLGLMPEAVAAAIAAQAVGRPVKVVMSRQNVFETTGRRPATVQRVRLGADDDGRLTAIAHETVCDQLPEELYFEPAGVATHLLYSGANRLVDHRVARVNKVLAVSMRAPGEAVGQLSLECALDELAEKLELDPLELRIRNEPQVHPEEGVPFSSRKLVECYRTGAERFGWSSRNLVPGSVRDGEWLIGQGMAAAARGNLFGPSQARVRLQSDGRVIVETEMTDIGTGTYTLIAQIAADLLGVSLSDVEVRLGDTDDPPSAGSGGSWGAATSGSAVYVACEKMRSLLVEAAGTPLQGATFAQGWLTAPDGKFRIADLVGDGLTVTGSASPGESNKRFNQCSYGAHFCEVRVNATTAEIRVNRWNSVFAAGRIINLKTAKSQAIGGIVFGIGSAITEEMIHDRQTGKIVNRDFGEYHVPVHADVPDIDVLFLEERDLLANPLHAKGIGELGICGSGAAIANAIYNATGVRVREFPITLDKLLMGLPD